MTSCNLTIADSAKIGKAVAGERPVDLRATRPVGEQGSWPAVPSNPNSRLGRLRSPLAQGWDQMDTLYVGIDVSKDRLDVAVRRNGEGVGGESFVVSRDGAGIDDLIGRLKVLAPRLIAIEATG